MRCFLLFLTLPLFIHAALAADDCTHGSPNSEDCLSMLKQVETRLNGLYAKRQGIFVGEYKKDYDQTYIDEMVKSYNEANHAWVLYRDKEC